MKKSYIIIFTILAMSINAQDVNFNNDRQFVIDNLNRTKNEMVVATQNLSEQQWHFHPTDTSWSIAQVVEHMGLYERLTVQELSISINIPPQSIKTLTDQTYLDWMAESQPHISPNHATPLEFMEGKENLDFFVFGRNDLMLNIADVKDLNVYYTPRSNEPTLMRSLHGLLVVHYGHTDRHLRQIARIKAHFDFPNDKNQILKTMQAETAAFYASDYIAWQNEWVHEPSSVVAWNQADGKYVYMRGWKEINDYFKKGLTENLWTSYPDFKVANIYVEINDNFAHAFYDEYVVNDKGMYSKVPGNKMFKKVDGKWKLYSVISFWNREYVFTKKEIDEIVRK